MDKVTSKVKSHVTKNSSSYSQISPDLPTNVSKINMTKTVPCAQSGTGSEGLSPFSGHHHSQIKVELKDSEEKENMENITSALTLILGNPKPILDLTTDPTPTPKTFFFT